MTAEPPRPAGVVRAGESFGIGNEFTGVQVRKVWTRQGERLELFVPRRGDRILLDAMQLEIIARQDPERFSQLFALSLGSEDAPVGGVPDERPDEGDTGEGDTGEGDSGEGDSGEGDTAERDGRR